MTQTSATYPSSFQPSQILCLEHESACLYVEVIQVATNRPLCWVRPLMLSRCLDERSDGLPCLLVDLRQTADLLWSIDCFRVALDTEVIPLLTKLEEIKSRSEDDQAARQQLQSFMRQIWQAQAALA